MTYADPGYYYPPGYAEGDAQSDLLYTVPPLDALYKVPPLNTRYTVNAMTIGKFWNISDPNRHWGPLDESGVLPIPIAWDKWLASIGEGFGSHTFDPDPLLDVVTEDVRDGVIYIKVQFASKPDIGTYYPLRCHVLSDGTPPSEEDLTLWFKAVAK